MCRQRFLEDVVNIGTADLQLDDQVNKDGLFNVFRVYLLQAFIVVVSDCLRESLVHELPPVGFGSLT